MATAAVLPFTAVTASPVPPPLHPPALRRRTTLAQGRALELLGHAIEYMVDSRLPEGGPTRAENQAIRILMTCSREVFEQGTLYVPAHQRVSYWVQQRLRRRAPAQ